MIVVTLVILLCGLLLGQMGQQTYPSRSEISESGRYQIVLSPNVRADLFLLDTQTGRIWQRQTLSDVPDHPDAWFIQDRLDSHAEANAWINQQRLAK